MTPTTTRPRRLILRDDEAAALAGAGRAVVWRPYTGWMMQYRHEARPVREQDRGPAPWKPGDAAWGAEAWALPPDYDPAMHGSLKVKPRIGPVCFRADYPTWLPWPGTTWRTAEAMPLWASRLPRLVVAAVSVEERGGRWGWRIEVERSEP